jgi:CheY-like chemotaxis protein
MLEQQGQGSMKVLVVEDESLIAMQIESVLRAAGTTSSGRWGGWTGRCPARWTVGSTRRYST